MPKVDLNPLQESAGADLTKISGYKRIAYLVVSFGLFFTAMAFGKDLSAKIQKFLADVFGLESSNNGPTIKVA